MGQTPKTFSIVLVEDNPADVLLVQKALQAKGINCSLTCFDSGEKALKNLSQKGRLAPDLILLDLNLPGVDGVDVLGKVLAIPRLSEVPVVILTSSESASDMQRTARMGAAHYIRKPSALEDFYKEVGCGVQKMLLGGESG
jgi:CheY-like chemotaxis protein